MIATCFSSKGTELKGRSIKIVLYFVGVQFKFNIRIQGLQILTYIYGSQTQSKRSVPLVSVKKIIIKAPLIVIRRACWTGPVAALEHPLEAHPNTHIW